MSVYGLSQRFAPPPGPGTAGLLRVGALRAPDPKSRVGAVIAYIPAEALAIFLIVMGFLDGVEPGGDSKENKELWAVIAFLAGGLTIVVFAILAAFDRRRKGMEVSKLRWLAALGVSFVAFVLYVMAVPEGALAGTVKGLPVTLLGAGLSGAFLLFVPPIAKWVGLEVGYKKQVSKFPAIPATKISVGTVGLQAESDSGLPVEYESKTPDTCEVGGNGTDVILQNVGECTIEAGQPGNAQFAKARGVSRTFDITSPTGSI